MMDGMKGWVLSELENVRCTEQRNELPRMKKGGGIYTMPMDYPWSLPARPCEAHYGTGAAETVEPVPVDTAPLLTGSIGTLTGISIICDVYQPNPKYQTKYIYSLVHRRGKVMVYVWERNPKDNTSTTYWYEYRSAREARVDMKKHGIGRRGW
jgi:hypothetical protein